MSRMPQDYLLKVIVVGDSAVGKTKLLSRFADNSYNTSYVSTIGVDFKVQTIVLDGKKVKFQIWDTAGQERYRTIAQTYYKGASGVILAYSVTDPDSLVHIGIPYCKLDNWTAQIREIAQADIKMYLVGNKMDDEADRKVSSEQGQKMADKYGIPFSETSAKEGTNVSRVFEQLGRAILAELSKIPLQDMAGCRIQECRVPPTSNRCNC